MKLYLCLFFLGTLFFTRCGSEQAGGSKQTPTKATAPAGPPAETTPAPGPPSGLKTSLVALPEPNRYQVRLSWDKTRSDSAEWDLSRLDPIRGVRPLGSFAKHAGEFVDSEVAAGESYRYRLSPAVGGEAPLEASVSVPRDLLVNREVHLRQIRGMRRVFLAPPGKILTDENYFELVAEEIVAQGGSIETFPEGLTLPGRDGRSGGTLLIRTRTGSGKLFITARGEPGGNGTPGTAGKEGGKGAPGKDAVIAVGGLPLGLIPRPEDHDCVSQTGDGEQGTPGLAGGNGGNGGRGGNSGSIFVEVLDPSALEIVPRFSEGASGTPGPGGLGGLGGPGGDPGKRDVYERCRKASPGLPGINGLPGKDGIAGGAGLRQTLCLKLGTATYGDCADFPSGESRVW
jgi:hypothetical protein